MNIAVRELTRNCGSSSKSLVHSINFLTNKMSLDFCKKNLILYTVFSGLFGYTIKTTVVYRCLKDLRPLRENKSGFQTKTVRSVLNIRRKQRNNRNTDVQRKQTPINIGTDVFITFALFLTWFRTFKKKMVLEPGF